MISEDDHERFRSLTDEARRVALTTHVNPDGDALGSQVSLAEFLRSRGKHVRIINHDRTPEILQFLEEGATPVELYVPAVHDRVLREVDRVLLVDNSAPDRLGGMESVMRDVAQRTLCIDHHPSRGTPWRDHVLDETACATAIMIHELTVGCGWAPSPRAAEAMYVGLVTDTGFFRFNSTNPQAHLVAAQLLELGVRPACVYQEIYERNSLALTRLMGQALSALHVLADGQVAAVEITREMLARVDASDVDTSEITTPLLALEGVSVAVLFREQDDRRVKVSLRSKGTLDVHRLAAEFGGGGHRNASGIVIEGRLSDVVAAVTARITECLRSGG